MTGIDLFVRNKGTSRTINSVTSPFCISHVSEVISCSYEHSNRSVPFNFCQVHNWWNSLSIMLLIKRSRSPVIELELLRIYHLTVMDQCLERSASREVPHINLESLLIIQSGVRSDQESLDQLTQLRNVSTSYFSNCIRPFSEYAVYMQQIKSVFDQCGKLCSKYQQCRPCVVQFCNWGKGDKNVNAVLPVLWVILKSIKHLGCSLRMPNERDSVFISVLFHIVYHCRSV